MASHLNNVSAALDKLCTDYESIILPGDFDIEFKEKKQTFEFTSRYNLKSLVKQKACFKNPENPSFQNGSVFETGLSDFNNLTTTVLKQCFPRSKPRIVNYRDCRNFRNKDFRAELDNEKLKHEIYNIEYQHFLNILL